MQATNTLSPEKRVIQLQSQEVTVAEDSCLVFSYSTMTSADTAEDRNAAISFQLTTEGASRIIWSVHSVAYSSWHDAQVPIPAGKVTLTLVVSGSLFEGSVQELRLNPGSCEPLGIFYLKFKI